MATNLTPCHPGDGIEALNRLRGLAEPPLQIDLDRELQQSGEKTPGSGKPVGVPRRSRNILISGSF